FAAYAMEVAVTVDDLPLVGALPDGLARMKVVKKMLDVLSKHGIKGVYGFLNAKRIKESPDGLDILKAWVANGHYLGNHTYSHLDLNKFSLQEFLDDIAADEPSLSRFFDPRVYRFFRYPFLHEGNTREKRDGVRSFLQKRGYKIAQVTVDFSEWAWNDPYSRCL